jgi:hypothetical protein
MKMRMTRRGAVILIALMMTAVPAAAAVLTQNFMRADISLSGACFTKVAGADAATIFADFSTTPTIQSGPNNVTLFQETASLQGYAGDRLIYTDAAQFVNNCGVDMRLVLLSENDPFGGAAIDPPAIANSVWSSMDVFVYVATIAAPTERPSPSSSQWQLMFSVTAGGTLSQQSTAVTVPNGGSRRLGFVIDTDSAFTGSASGTLRWTAQATP